MILALLASVLVAIPTGTAVAIADGSLIWTTVVGGVDSSPVVAKGVVYVGSDDGNIYALDASTGVYLWVRDMSGVDSSPVVAKGVVYVGAEEADE
jgi:outer membrane protein assembly factor BamB